MPNLSPTAVPHPQQNGHGLKQANTL